MRKEIRTRLAHYRAVDAREREHLRAMRRLADAPLDPCARDHFRPGHFTASAFLLAPDDASLLLIHHQKPQRWLQPGGHIEPTDSSVEDAARREVEEETGLVSLELLAGTSPLFDLDVHEIPDRPGEPAHLHHDLRVLLRAREHRIRAGDGVSAAQWMELDAVPSLSTDDSVRRVGEKIARLTARLRARG